MVLKSPLLQESSPLAHHQAASAQRLLLTLRLIDLACHPWPVVQLCSALVLEHLETHTDDLHQELQASEP